MHVCSYIGGADNAGAAIHRSSERWLNIYLGSLLLARLTGRDRVKRPILPAEIQDIERLGVGKQGGGLSDNAY